MIDVRKLPLSEGWVLVPRERAARPHDFRSADAVRLPTRCPFCAGHESDTPEPLAVYPADAGDDWRVRVIPNKFPAVSPFGKRRRSGPSPGASAAADPFAGRFPAARSEGWHEVIVESPRHVTRFSELNATELRYTLAAFRDRLRAHQSDSRLAYSLAFRNSGIGGGASLEHVHSQIIATAWVPSSVATEVRLSREWHDETGGCLLCEMVERERTIGERIVGRSRGFTAWCPYASRFAYETWIAPSSHRSAFHELSDRQLRELGRLLQDVVGRIERVPGSRGYNFWIHTAPHALPSSPFFHWHLEIAPRTARQAGFEWGGGDFINSVPPEQAAAELAP